jgi:hypothetical protein
MRKFMFVLVAMALLLSGFIAIKAQTTGSMSGLVTDPNGAILAGANVTLKNAATGFERSTVTNDKGIFGFTALQPGIYSVTVENRGFKRALASEITVQVSTEATMTIALEIGQASETVTVSASQDVINTSSPTLTNVINTRQVVDLPLPTRNPMDLAALQAGIAVTGTGTRTANVGGLRGSATNVTQDGVNAMDNFVKTDSFFALTAPSLNSVGEFSITTGTTGSDSGRGVAQVNLVTKGGTNQYHGSIFYLIRNDALESNFFFNNQVGTPRQTEHQHFFGFTIGGPVYFLGFGEGKPAIWNGHDKAFFFFSYEGFREHFQATRNRTVLTPEARTGLFRYTGTNGQLQTVNLLSVGLVHVLNPITQAQLNAMPVPNNTLVGDGLNTSGAQFNVVGSDPSDKYVVRYDHQLVEKSRFGSHKLEFVYNRAHFVLFPDTFNAIEAPFPGGIDAGQASVRSLATGALHSTFGSSMTNDFRYGRQWAPVSFLRNAPPTGPFITLAAPTTNYDNQFMSQGRNTIVDQYSDDFSITKGSHLIRFGASYEKIFADTFNDAGINEVITLGTNGSNPDGISAASFPFSVTADVNRARPIYADLVGNLASAVATFNVTSPTSGFVQGATRSRIFREQDVALYVQDQWRAKSNLTLNYGVRWEFEGVPTIPNGLAIQVTNFGDLYGVSGPGNLFKPTAPAGPPPGIATLDFVSGKTGKELFKDDWNNFAPFVGFAYQPDFKSGMLRKVFGAPGTTSIRAGYSISYLHDGFTVISNALGTGVTNAGLIQNSAVTTPTGVLGGAIPLSAPAFSIPITDKKNFDLSSFNGLWAINPKLKTPWVGQWSVGIEREIFKNTALEVRYVGNHAYDVYRAFDINEVNIFENGFLQEFLNAQTNLALNGGISFADVAHGGAAGTISLPILSKFFTGFANTSTSAWRSSGFISNLQNQNVGSFANTLAFSNTYKANRQSALIGIPANFFVANPNAAFAVQLDNNSMSNYNSLQVELRRRFSQGLQFQADYTFSKSLTDASGAVGSQSDISNFRTLRDPNLDQIRSSIDQTHRFVANALYELPFGKGKPFWGGANGFVDKLVGGWTIGSIVTWQGRPPFYFTSGRSTFNCTPSRLTTSNGCTINGNSAQLLIPFKDFKKNIGLFRRPEGIYFINPDILNITLKSNGTFQSSTLKPGILGVPAPGTLGNYPLNSVGGPNYFDVDFSVVKRVSVGERVKLELKTTLINALNHPNFIFANQNFDSTSFGLITSQSGNQRIIHFTGTMNF